MHCSHFFVHGPLALFGGVEADHYLSVAFDMGDGLLGSRFDIVSCLIEKWLLTRLESALWAQSVGCVGIWIWVQSRAVRRYPYNIVFGYDQMVVSHISEVFGVSIRAEYYQCSVDSCEYYRPPQMCFGVRYYRLLYQITAELDSSNRIRSNSALL